MTRKVNDFDRRSFLKASAGATLALATAGVPRTARASQAGGKRVVVLAFDGMDPGLTEAMMAEGRLPNLSRLRERGGYRRLGTSIPPQTPVAFSTVITGTGPGHHGIFDFIHRDPSDPTEPLPSYVGNNRGSGYWEVGDHRLQLTFWPFGHEPPEQVLQRHGVPFWDHLDERGIRTWVYEIPSNFPPGPSPAGHHRALAGLGTPDLLGTYGTYQHFAQDGPYPDREDGGGRSSRVIFRNDRAVAELHGPPNTFLKKDPPPRSRIEFVIYRDRDADAAMIEIEGRRMLLKRGEWSDWVRLDYRLRMPDFLPDEHISGICRFYLQEVAPTFRLYVTPIQIDPAKPALRLSEPAHFVEEIAGELGMFYTAGFQEDYSALRNGVFTDDEFMRQADIVLDERDDLLDYALNHYEDGLLLVYFACTDLQAHMFWWDSDEPHPIRDPQQAKRGHDHIKDLYARMDAVVGRVRDHVGDSATLLVMSDHGFSNFRRQFSLATWLRDNGYTHPANAKTLKDIDWSKTRAYALGLNGLFLNLEGRESGGSVRHGAESDALLAELAEKLLAVRDGERPVIEEIYRGDDIYDGPRRDIAPDLVLGYSRDYRASWGTVLGDMTEEILSNNTSAWSADHCVAAKSVPGILFANRAITADAPRLEDLAPTLLAEFGVGKPEIMVGHDLFERSFTT